MQILRVFKKILLLQSILFLILQAHALSVPPQPLAPILPARSGMQVVKPESILNLPPLNFNDATMSWLDDSNIIYCSPPTESLNEWNIESINIITKKRTLLGHGWNAKPSPDGKWIGFIHGENEKTQFWLMSSDGSNSKQISYVPQGIFPSYYSDFAWSSDSKQIALFYKPNFKNYEPSFPESVINLFNVETSESSQLISMDAFIADLSWLPNSNVLLFRKEITSVGNPGKDDHESILTLRLQDKQIKSLAEFDGLQQLLAPTSSFDGKQIAFMYDADNPAFNFMTSLGLVHNNSNSNSILIRRLTNEMQLMSPTWSKNNRSIYAIRTYGPYRQIYSFNAESGLPKQITKNSLNISDYAVSPDGAKIVWLGQDPQGNHRVQIATNNGQDVTNIISVSEASDNTALSEVREISWNSPDYPVSMKGLLFLPLNYIPDQKYPLIVDIHGGDIGASLAAGPVGSLLMTTSLEWHMWAAKGYAVFVPEFRSSGNFGSLGISRDFLKNHDRLGGDLKDINSCIDKLIADGLVDEQHIAIIGHSAGGLRANWITATTHRFKTVVSSDGWADEYITALREPPNKRIYEQMGGSPQEVPENYLKNSPLQNAIGATIPTLFFKGNPKLGATDDYYESTSAFNDFLKSQGVETEFIYFSDEGHVFQKPENRKTTLERSIQWIDSHI